VTSGVVIFNALGAFGLHIGKLAKGIGSAIGYEAAEINVGDVAAALGFVHVMGGDEEGDAVAGGARREDPKAGGEQRGSIPAVGSSRNRSFGSWSMAQPRARRCFHPPEKLSGRDD